MLGLVLGSSSRAARRRAASAVDDGRLFFDSDAVLVARFGLAMARSLARRMVFSDHGDFERLGADMLFGLHRLHRSRAGDPAVLSDAGLEHAAGAVRVG